MRMAKYWKAEPPPLWWAEYVKAFKPLPRSTLPSGITYGAEYSTFAISPTRYLRYLEGRIKDLGGHFGRATLPIDGGLAKAVEHAITLCGLKVESRPLSMPLD